MDYDVFISHASEDKENVARPLAYELRKIGLRVWIDECELTIGDSLRRKIDNGLSCSKYGIVILSPAFFSKEWPNKELDGLFARENGSNKVILPIWHNVTASDVLKFSPMLADKVAISTARGIVYIANTVAAAVRLRTSEGTSSFVKLDEKTHKNSEGGSNVVTKITITFIIFIAIGYTAIIRKNESPIKTKNDISDLKEIKKIDNPSLSINPDKNPAVPLSDRPESHSEDKINKIIINKGACPFECCQYGEWIARQQMDIDLFDFPNGKSFKEKIKKGEKVSAITGEIHSLPIAATVTSLDKYDEQQGIRKYDNVNILHGIGEGAVAYLHKGNIKDSSLDFRYEILDKHGPVFPENTWWVKIRFKDGKEGWIKDTSSFGGKDGCS